MSVKRRACVISPQLGWASEAEGCSMEPGVRARGASCSRITTKGVTALVRACENLAIQAVASSLVIHKSAVLI